MAFDTILQNITTPMEFTYLGIGSAPHAKSIDEFDDVWDQLVPVFVRDQAAKTRRIIHFDPTFSHSIEFVKTYFATKYPELAYSKTEFYHLWSSPRLEVLVVENSLQYKNKFYESDADHEWFLQALCASVLRQNAHLVIQDFSGRDLADVFKRVYENSSNKHLFKKKVLFDITYGHASCMTDLTKNRPIYDASGNFMNFLLYTPSEVQASIGKNARLDELIKEYYVKRFREALNLHHVNYRRRTKGEGCMYTCELYNDTSTPQLIMGYLQSELTDIFLVLKDLAVFTAEKEHQFRYLMKYYDQVNMYDWGTSVSRLV